MEEEGPEETPTKDSSGTVASVPHFEVIPTIPLKKGKIVKSIMDKYRVFKFRNTVPEPLDLMDILYETFETLLIIDLDGIQKNRPAVDIYKKISQLGDFWIDGGVRYCDSVIDLLITGAQYAVLSTKTLNDLNELKEAFELSENIIFGLDYNNGIISSNNDIRNKPSYEVLTEVHNMGIEKCLFMDLGRGDPKIPLNVDTIKMLQRTRINLYVGGGVKSSDLKLLSDLKVSGAVVDLDEIITNPEVFGIDLALLNEIAPEVKDDTG